jgi:hypothetical protein
MTNLNQLAHFKTGLKKEMNYCPCCSTLLLKHIRKKSEIHWFCRSCWQDMPVFTANLSGSLSQTILDKTPINIQKEKQTIRQYTCLHK